MNLFPDIFLFINSFFKSGKKFRRIEIIEEIKSAITNSDLKFMLLSSKWAAVTKTLLSFATGEEWHSPPISTFQSTFLDDVQSTGPATESLKACFSNPRQPLHSSAFMNETVKIKTNNKRHTTGVFLIYPIAVVLILKVLWHFFPVQSFSIADQAVNSF